MKPSTASDADVVVSMQSPTPPKRSSISGGGDGLGSLGNNNRSMTMNGRDSSTPRDGRRHRSKLDQLKTSTNLSSSGSGGRNGSGGLTGLNGNSRGQNNQHYHHRHSRATTSLTAAAQGKQTNSGNSSSNHVTPQVGSSNGNVQRDGERRKLENIAQQPSLNRHSQHASGGGQHHQYKRSHRRTVSLPKAGSRLMSQNSQNQINVSNSADNTKKVSSGTISRPTTHSLSISESNNNVDTNNNNVFPPISGSHAVSNRVVSGTDEHHLDVNGLKHEMSSLSPRVLAVSRLTMLGGVAASQAEVPPSRLHFLPEPTFESVQQRTPPTLPKTPGLTAANASKTGANGSGPTAANGIHPTASPPDQQQPLSPASQSEKAKVKFEKKVQLSNGVNDKRSLSPSPQQQQKPSVNGVKAREGQGTPTQSTSPPNYNNNNNVYSNNTVNSSINNNTGRRDSLSKSRPKRGDTTVSKSLPKLAATEEPFSIRRKIEQFRKWHEEQYRDKLKRFEADAAGGNTSAQIEGIRGASVGNSNNGLVDYAKVLDLRIAEGDKDGQNNDMADEGQGNRPGTKVHKQHFGRESNIKQITSTTSTAAVYANGSMFISRSAKANGDGGRPISAVTWKTWRDVNMSDAYTDVKKYIQENDLMDDERKAWIKSWIDDVEEAMVLPSAKT